MWAVFIGDPNVEATRRMTVQTPEVPALSCCIFVSQGRAGPHEANSLQRWHSPRASLWTLNLTKGGTRCPVVGAEFNKFVHRTAIGGDVEQKGPKGGTAPR